ncbi:hypothetical protein M5K25_008049 [Dendrobium thyrsiflorum]|uniref:Uncharacterized protein n=1 Tax=Dendrobium thyrsiflorum TaxID=117978 RepID=A0ABD0VER0_DENTH
MVNRHSSRIVGASRSNSHQSRNQSMNHRRPISGSFYLGGQNVAGEGTSGPSLEERIRKMEESQNEILQLLRETRQLALAPPEEVLLPQNPPLANGVQFEHLQEENPLPLPRMHPLSQQDNELADTTSSTHPSHTGRQPRIPQDLPEDLARSHVAELPRNALRHELRRLRRGAESSRENHLLKNSGKPRLSENQKEKRGEGSFKLLYKRRGAESSRESHLLKNSGMPRLSENQKEKRGEGSFKLLYKRRGAESSTNLEAKSSGKLQQLNLGSSELRFQQTYNQTERLKNTNPTTPNST